MSSGWHEIAPLIDYADLRVDTQERDLRLLCLEAEKFGVQTVVVNPVNVALTATLVQATAIKVAAAVSYPIGAYWPDEKGLEIADAIVDGADEIYMVMSVGLFRSGQLDQQTIPEMATLVQEARGRPTKLITELSVLSDEQKRTVCRLAINAGIDYLVTSTSFVPSKLPPVTVDDINVVAEAAGDSIGVLYMGDVASVAQVEQLRAVGIRRFATSTVRALYQSYLSGGQPVT